MAYSRMTINQLRDPKENTAFVWLLVFAIPSLVVVTIVSIGMFLGVVALFALLRLMGELFAVAYIKVNAIRASDTQLPELHHAAALCCERLSIEMPDVYVLQQSLWNALAMKVAGRRLVVLLSGAVDSLLLKGDMQQLTWLVGHEIGHHAAGHLDFWRGSVAAAGAWIPWLYLWYKRRGELTCDRIGLFCSGSLQATLSAMANMTVGAQLAEKVDVDEAIRQWHAHRGEFFVRYRTIYSTHPHTLWRFEEASRAAAALDIPIVARIPGVA